MVEIKINLSEHEKRTLEKTPMKILICFLLMIICSGILYYFDFYGQTVEKLATAKNPSIWSKIIIVAPFSFLLFLGYVIPISYIIFYLFFRSDKSNRNKETKIEAYRKLQHILDGRENPKSDKIETIDWHYSMITTKAKKFCEGIDGAFCSKEVKVLVENMTYKNAEKSIKELREQMQKEIED